MLKPFFRTTSNDRAAGFTLLGRAADTPPGRAGLDWLAAHGLLWPLRALRPFQAPRTRRRGLAERGPLWSLGLLRRRLVTSRSDVCIEGFPRSGNTFTVFVFRLWNPDVRVADHLHLPLQVSRAVKLGVPCCVLVRRPLDVVCALRVHRRASDDACFESYIRFHRQIAPLRDQIVVCRFEEVTEDPSILVDRLNDRCETSFSAGPITAEGKAWVMRELEVRSQGSTAMGPEIFATYPTAEKERRKAKLRSHLARHPLLSEAEAAYASVCGNAT